MRRFLASSIEPGKHLLPNIVAYMSRERPDVELGCRPGPVQPRRCHEGGPARGRPGLARPSANHATQTAPHARSARHAKHTSVTHRPHARYVRAVLLRGKARHTPRRLHAEFMIGLLFSFLPPFALSPCLFFLSPLHQGGIGILHLKDVLQSVYDYLNAKDRKQGRRKKKQ